ncbi:MAG TPA: pilus assembly protein TadG-related protein [Bryobacteraceae bacterium]
MRVRAQSGSRQGERGFVLIAMSVAMLLMLGVLGLAFDFGRIYIARNEAQVFTDAAAMTAASKLDGTEDGMVRARLAVAHLPMRWNLGTRPFTGVVVEFSPDKHSWARVTAPDNQVEITFLRAVGAPDSLTVPSHSVARTMPVRLTE